MIVAVTGTPGTGKTSVAEELAELLSCEYVDVNSCSERSDVEVERDEERGAEAVDVDSLVDALEDEVEDDAVLDGHLSHHFPADLTVVLRCEPGELRARLEEKGWSEEKIEENVEAEVLDLILQEAVSERERVAEIDTTGKEPREVAKRVKRLVDMGEVPDENLPGQVDWTGEYYG
ncbi:MAG: adenylate kinase family protein [Candidatus Nanohaloarchaea archaeon]